MNRYPRLPDISAWFGSALLVGANLCLLGSPSSIQAQQPSWSATGALVTARSAGHRVVLLATGKALVVGGGTASTELYDPATGQFSPTGSLSRPRSRPVVVRLVNGKVLAAAGTGDTSAEIYDPETGAWSATGGLGVARQTSAGVLLADGRVLLTGGSTSRSAELYDPISGTWSLAGTMTAIRSGGTVRPDAKQHTSTLLPDGKVLVVGGDADGALRSAELYDPATGSWTATGDLITPRFNHTATLLTNGKVLVAGGAHSFGACPGLADAELAELYDPATGQWSAANSLTTPRAGHAATLLPDGKVLVVGGNVMSSCNDLSSSELYDPVAGTWTAIGDLKTAYIPAQSVLLADGKVLAVGWSRADLLGSGSASFALPQFVFGGGWSTSLYFSNTTGAEASFQVRFLGDDGAPLSVPLRGAGSLSSITIDLRSGGTAILEVPNTGDFGQGWAEATLPFGVTGYAVFRQVVPGRADQEATAPLIPESGARTAGFAYDDVNNTTAMAFVNSSGKLVTAMITIYRNDGAQLGSTQLTLNPRSKRTTILRDLPGLSGAAGTRGGVTFSVSDGTISVLGLRFGAEAFTNIPVTHGLEAAYSLVTLPHLASGGSWHTSIYLSNTTNFQLSPRSYFDNSLNWATGPADTIQLLPKSTVILETLDTSDLLQTWGSFLLPPGVTSYAVFRQSVAGRADQEAAVPLATSSSQAVDLTFDDTTFTTTFAVANPNDRQVVVTVSVYGADGSQIGSSQLTLGPTSNTAAVLRNLPGLEGVLGRRGRAAFSADSGPISVVGFRFGGEAFTSIPVTRR